MLVLKRKRGERLRIGDDVVVHVIDVRGGHVRLGIDAPAAVRILREELLRAVASENQRAMSTPPLHVRSRLGTFAVPAETLIHFPDGLIGFPDRHRFVIVDHRPGAPFKWLLCVDDPALAFAVADPLDLVAGYEAPTTCARRALAAPHDEITIFALMRLSPDPQQVTLNLLAPISVDLRTRTAVQLVLDTDASPAHPIAAPPRAVAI